MKKIEMCDLPFYCSLTVIVIALFSILLCGCGHQVGIVGLGTGFRVGGGEYGVSYGEGLFGTFVTRDGVNFKAELDSTQGFTYDPASNTYKGIRSIEYSVAPQLNGYTVDVAKESPEAVASYYDALVKYYQSKGKGAVQPLISEEKSKAATVSMAEILKNAIATAKGIVQDKETADGEESVFQCNGDCDYKDLTQNPEISYQLSIALKLLTYDGYQKRMPSTDEYYTTTIEHFVTQLVTYRAGGHKNTPLRVKYVTVEKGVITKLMFVYIKRDGETNDVECPSCLYMDPNDAD